MWFGGRLVAGRKARRGGPNPTKINTLLTNIAEEVQTLPRSTYY
jgi:hypothetical protein